jgi:arsenate reductase
MLHDLSETVQANVRRSLEAVVQADQEGAREVLRQENVINQLEVRLEEACLKVMTLHQPFADEMRFLVATTKVDRDLERVGDLAAAVAKRVHELEPEALAAFLDPVRSLTEGIQKNLELSLRAFFYRDHRQATERWLADDRVDAQVASIAAGLRNAILKEAGHARCYFALLAIVQYLERLADHAANIAKHVIYMVLGEIVRHRMREYRASAEVALHRVLVVCVHNSARSQMAAAWINHLYGERIYAESAGLQPGTLHPLAVEVMREVGIDISGSIPRDVFDVSRSGHPFSFVIRVCDGVSAEKCPPFIGVKEELNWDVPDPAGFTGEKEVLLDRFRETRDDIRRRIELWVTDLFKQ